jgi:hypothetical protein
MIPIKKLPTMDREELLSCLTSNAYWNDAPIVTMYVRGCNKP